MRYIVKWSFEDTEFENLQYKEALREAGLPKVIIIDDDEEEIETHALEEYGFELESWEED